VSTFGRASGGETLAATDAVAARLDEIQLDLGEGPAWDALRDRRTVLVSDDAGSDGAAWPLFSAASAPLGMGTILSVPLLYADVAIGVVGLYGGRGLRVSSGAVASAVVQSQTTFFEVLAHSVKDAYADASVNPRSRRVVHQATGMILQHYGIPADDAMILLRAHAFTMGRSVVDVAQDIVTRRAPFLDPGTPSKDSL
jgi:hypothetical protein